MEEPKELTSLPEKWCIAVTEESYFVLSEWRDAGGLGNVSGYCLSYYQNSKGWWVESKSPSEWPEYTEITFDQFKKWALKESSEVSLVGRYLRYIGTSKGIPMYGDFFRIDSMESEGLFRLRDNEPNCNWKPEEVINGTCKSFELMPEGFTPPLTASIPPLSSSEIPSERGSGIIQQIESVKDYGVLTEEKLRGIVSDLVYTPSEPSPKVDTALPMISFVIPPREI
jgi:hypothetical protein